MYLDEVAELNIKFQNFFPELHVKNKDHNLQGLMKSLRCEWIKAKGKSF